MKKLLLILVLLNLSCSSNSEKLTSEIKNLNNKNDSLQKIIDTLNTKFIFEEARLRIIPSTKNTYEKDSEFKGEIVVIVRNKTDYALFSQNYNHANWKKNSFVNPDTLKTDYGGYRFKMKYTKSPNDSIYFTVKVRNKLGGAEIEETVIHPMKNFP